MKPVRSVPPLGLLIAAMLLELGMSGAIIALYLPPTHHELQTVQAALETAGALEQRNWTALAAPRAHGDSNDPTPRAAHAPLTIWAQAVTIHFSSPRCASAPNKYHAAPHALAPSPSIEVHRALLRARILGIFAELLLLVGIYWIGAAVHDALLGGFAALVAAALPLLHFSAGLASPHMLACALATMASASMLWAMQPFVRIVRADQRIPRRKWHWPLGGALLALASLSGGPLWAIMGLLAPALGLVLMVRSVSAASRGLIIAVILAGIIALPWYLAVIISEPAVADDWKHALRAMISPLHPKWSAGLVALALMLPWLAWIVLSSMHPFRASVGGVERRRRIMPLIWLGVACALVISLLVVRIDASLMLIAPAALLSGYHWRDQQRLAERGTVDRGGGRLLLVHWLWLLVLSVIGPLALVQGSPLLEVGMISSVISNAMPWRDVALLAPLLLIIALLGWNAHRRWRPLVAMLVTITWIALATAIVLRA